MASSNTGQGGNLTLTSGTAQGGSVTITSGSGVSTGQSGGITLTGGQPGSIQVGTAQHSQGLITPTDSGQWTTISHASQEDTDQLRLEMFDLQQTVKLLMRQNQRLSDEVEALKAGVILEAPDLA